MAHEAQVRYSDLVLAKMRAENILKDGVIFNNDYEGDPVAGAVKVPVRDDEVKVGDYDRSKGGDMSESTTVYRTILVNREKYVNELIDGYDAASVPDNLVADRLDSAGYSLARTLDHDGGSTLIAQGTKLNISSIGPSTIYGEVVNIRTQLSKANVPDDGKRYLLVSPDTYASLLKCPEFVKASALGDSTVQTGLVGKIAGLNVYEWNDSTANLAMIAGHPRYATRVNAWKVPVAVNDLADGKHIGASAVQGRTVYCHEVLRKNAVYAVFAAGSLTAAMASFTGKDNAAGKANVTVSEAATASFVYRVNPVKRAALDESFSELIAEKSFESGVTEITAKRGDIVEIIDLNADGKCVRVGYVTVA